MARKTRFRSPALQDLHTRYIGDNPERVASFEAALANAEIARDIYRLRTEAGLTQKELAQRVGTTASVICRLEDAEYEGHSLSMLRRVAAALDRRVEIRFPPARPAAVPSPETQRGSANPAAATVKRPKKKGESTPRATAATGASTGPQGAFFN